MKTIKKYLYQSLAIVMLCAIFSCESTLDLAPEDSYGSGNFWQNEAQVRGYVIGMHASLRGAYQFAFKLGEARGGTLIPSSGNFGTSLNWPSPIKDNDFTKDKTGISSWDGSYPRILDINLFIQKVTEECDFLSDADRKYYLAQAHGLRALQYFWLYKTYGGVPLISTPTLLEGTIDPVNLYTPRSTPAQTLKFIKEDVNKSEELFEGRYLKGDHSMWSLAATQMLKTDIYMWSAKVTTGDHPANKDDLKIAKSTLENIVGNFSLMDDFSKVFTEKNNKEVIFSLRFKEGESTNFMSEFIMADNQIYGLIRDRNGELVTEDILDKRGTGLLRHEYKWEIWDVFDKEDTRRDATFVDFYAKADSVFQGIVTIKNFGILNSTNQRIYEGDIHLYRYAEALLMMAEIENTLGNAVAPWINQVRERAYKDNYSDFKYTDSTFEDNEKAILRERDKEFITEGKRWHDLVRMQDANGQPLAFSADCNYRELGEPERYPVLNADERHKLLWPIDLTTMINDPKVEQTPGYE